MRVGYCYLGLKKIADREARAKAEVTRARAERIVESVSWGVVVLFLVGYAAALFCQNVGG